ncbi:MAG: ComF family protein [Cellvibrionaceae bacterium]
MNACYSCGIPLSQKHDLNESADICGNCLKSPPSYHRCIPAFIYDTPIDNLISKFKNHRDLTAGHALSAFLWDQISKHTDHSEYPDIITPVPLHWRRQLTRSFNQSAFIAQQLSRLSGIPLCSSTKRKICTPKQQQLTRSQRLCNLKNTFQVDSTKVKDKHLAIVDDVVTTGATADSLSTALKKAGAKRVDVWCISRTPKRGSG